MTFEEIMQKVEESRALRAALATSPRPCAFRTRGGTAVIHSNTHPGHVGDWRVSFLDRDEQPSGHADAGDFADALEIAYRAGADFNSEVAP